MSRHGDERPTATGDMLTPLEQIDREAERARRALLRAHAHIPRASYNKQWNATGRKIGTPLHRAAMREMNARDTDRLFEAAVRSEAETAFLGRLLQRCEEDWHHTHRAMLDGLPGFKDDR